MQSTIRFLNHCCQLAHTAFEKNEVPVGALIVHGNEIISEAHNSSLSHCDPTAHAEIVAIRQASKKLNTPKLHQCDLYTSLEPCLMCYQACKSARIKRIYFMQSDPDFGVFSRHHHLALEHSSTHKISGYGPYPQCTPVPPLKSFFQQKRKNQE